MQSRRPQRDRQLRRVCARTGLTAFALLAACRGPGSDGGDRAAPPVAAASPLRAALPPGTQMSVRELPSGPLQDDALNGCDGLVLAGQGWRVPALPTDAPAFAVVQRFVARGGRVLLLGHALALAPKLGLEDRPPDAVETFRWGFDDRTAVGRARLGIEVVSGRMPELFADLEAGGGEHTYFLCEGAPLQAPVCLFAAGPPAHGEVLARFVAERDGRAEAPSAPVLVRWRFGDGEVLGLGLEPGTVAAGRAAAADQATTRNAAAFHRQALRWLGGDRPPRHLACWLLPDPTPVPLPARLPPLAERDVPGASLLAHWGWVEAVHRDDGARTPVQVLDDVVLPGFQGGASVIALDLVDREQGLPLPWGESDPLARPAGYRGSAFARGWNGDALPLLLQEAHARGQLVQALLDPPPGGEVPQQRLVALRYLARQWGDLRRSGRDRVLDSVGVRQWFADDRGLAAAMLQDFQPAATVVSLGERMPPMRGAVGAVDAGDGRPAGAWAAGLVGGWRDGFDADRWPIGYLDCTGQRARRRSDPSAGGPTEGGTVAGGAAGSFGDWIALQAADFVRARRGAGGAMLWQHRNGAAVSPETAAYVTGVSSEPLVAAVAARCTATGANGWRAAQAALLGEVDPAFACSLPIAAATVQLANNHLRLCGSGGPVSFDPGGLARFGGDSSLLGEALFRTRFFGGRPDIDELRSQRFEPLAGGRRGEGGYGRAIAVEPGGPVPVALAFDDAPRWPQRLDLPLGAVTGRFELRLQARAQRGQGVLAVGLDDDVLALLPFADGRLAIQRALPIDCARAGARALRLEVLDGGAVVIDGLQLERVGDTAAEAEVVLPAGSLAIARECSVSTYHRETVELRMLADFPGVLVTTAVQQAVRSLQQERRFGLAHHSRLRFADDGEAKEGRLRRPFVLAADAPSLPDLAVVPLQLARYEHFRLEEGQLVWANQPEPGAASAVGLALLPRGGGPLLLEHLVQVFTALLRPAPLDLGAGGTADLRTAGSLPWTRVVAVDQPLRTPFMVREHGWWTWRSAQPARDLFGGDLLRVHQLPGDVVQVVGGQTLWGRTRPAAGSLAIVALREPQAESVTVRVLQSSPLSRPGVIMGADFDELFVDGRPWALFCDRTVLLPNRPGDYAVTTRRHGGAPAPHVVATAASLSHCAWDPAARELVLVADATGERPPELPFTAVLAGPQPRAVDGGELVDDGELRHADAAERAAARAAGAVIRFRPGIVRVRYGD